MASVKDILVKPIKASVANEYVKKHHYSGKVVPNSQLHFGCFLNGVLGGVMSFGPSMDKSKIQGLVKNTGWNDFLELNRMAFGELLPKNSESRCLSVAMRLIKKHYPNIKWIVSFADGCQCGDGTIYRATGFKLTGITKNKTIIQMPDGSTIADLILNLQLLSVKQRYDKMCGLDPKGHYNRNDYIRGGAHALDGFMLRYIYFIDKSYESNLTVPVLPFTMIDEMNARMYKGQKYVKDNACLVQEQNACVPVSDGGAIPTDTHHDSITKKSNNINNVGV